MFTFITIVAIATWIWFFYTDRRNTVTATKTGIGIITIGIKETASMVKTEAKIAKIHNDIADVETDRLAKFADRNAERIVKGALEDVGLGKEFRSEQANRLAAIEARFAESQAKANRKGA